MEIEQLTHIDDVYICWLMRLSEDRNMAEIKSRLLLILGKRMYEAGNLRGVLMVVAECKVSNCEPQFNRVVSDKLMASLSAQVIMAGIIG